MDYKEPEHNPPRFSGGGATRCCNRVDKNPKDDNLSRYPDTLISQAVKEFTPILSQLMAITDLDGRFGEFFERVGKNLLAKGRQGVKILLLNCPTAYPGSAESPWGGYVGTSLRQIIGHGKEVL